MSLTINIKYALTPLQLDLINLFSVNVCVVQRVASNSTVALYTACPSIRLIVARFMIMICTSEPTYCV